MKIQIEVIIVTTLTITRTIIIITVRVLLVFFPAKNRISQNSHLNLNVQTSKHYTLIRGM